jgi:hypothetical protein
MVYRPVFEITETGEYYGMDGSRRLMEEFLSYSAWRNTPEPRQAAGCIVERGAGDVANLTVD